MSLEAVTVRTAPLLSPLLSPFTSMVNSIFGSVFGGKVFEGSKTKARHRREHARIGEAWWRGRNVYLDEVLRSGSTLQGPGGLGAGPFQEAWDRLFRKKKAEERAEKADIQRERAEEKLMEAQAIRRGTETSVATWALGAAVALGIAWLVSRSRRR